MSEPTKMMSDALKVSTKHLVSMAQQLLQAEKSIKGLNLDEDTLDKIYIQKTGAVKQACLEWLEVFAEDENGEAD
jgi:hypothetical protein